MEVLIICILIVGIDLGADYSDKLSKPGELWVVTLSGNFFLGIEKSVCKKMSVISLKYAGIYIKAPFSNNVLQFPIHFHSNS